MWEGEKIQNKSLLVYLEQGLGDGIFALRYIDALIEQGATLEIVSRPAILPLIQSSYPNIKVHNEDEAVVVGYWDKIEAPDFWVYGLSIPFRAGLWRPINTAKFLSAPTDLIKTFTERIHRLNSKKLPVYTVNWHGRIDTDSDRSRAFSVQEFSQVTGIDKIQCIVISLQKEASLEEISILQEVTTNNGGQFINAAPELCDFAVTAAWIAASDRLLTCDTSVAHVGGALGHPTTVFARNKAIWQWLRRDRGETDTTSTAVWYDSVLVQYALAPEISWLFTTINKPKDSKELTNDKSNTSGNNNSTGSNSFDDNCENAQLPSPEVRTQGLRRGFRFAGRPD
jgi:hypothetical protein